MLVMTVSSEVSSVSHAGDGVSTAFTVPFRFLSPNDLQVRRRNADGSVTQLTTGFSITGGDPTGLVTFDAAPEAGTDIIIDRAPQLLQPAAYPSNDKFPAATHELALDRLTYQTQWLQRQLEYTLRFPFGEGSAGIELPSAPNRASKYLAFDADGNPEVADLVEGTITRSSIGQLLYPQTEEERAVGVTPTDMGYPPGDVRRYGDNAVPGTTDMTTALQAALNVAARGGGKVIIPPGRYRITSGLVWTWANHGLMVEGQGYDTQGGGSQIEYDGPAGGVLLHLNGAAGVHPVMIRGVAFKNVSAHTDIAGIHLTGIRNADVRENYFEGFERAIWTDAMVGYASIQQVSEFNFYIDNYFRDNKHALYAQKAGSHIVFFTNNRCHAQTGATVRVEWESDGTLGETYTHQWVIRDNWFYDDANPDPTIDIEGAAKGLLITGNYFEYNTSGSPKATIHVGTPGGLHAGVWITHNWFQGYPDSPGGVIEVANVDGLRVHGNVWLRSYSGSPPANAAFVRFLNATVTNYVIEYPALAFGAELLNTVRTSTGANITDKRVDTYGYEGTWTPGIAFGGASTGVGYGAQIGRYRRQGNLVIAAFRVALSAKGSSTGDMTITGLPFNMVNDEISYGASGEIVNASGFTGLTGSLKVSGAPNSAVINVCQSNTAGDASITNAAVTDATALQGTIAYFTS